MRSRWDALLDQKPIPLLDHLVEEAAKLLEVELAKWPLPVELLEDGPAANAQTALLSPDSKRPSETVYEEAFKTARMEVERRFDALDDYMRNRRWRERGLTDDARPALLLLNAFLVEQLLSLGEATEGRVSRKRMIDCLDRIERHFASRIRRQPMQG